jgi:hypothetical protein
MKYLLFFVLLALIAYQPAWAQFNKDTRPIGEVTELRVNEGIAVEWIQSPEKKIEVMVEGVGLDKVITEQAGGILRVRMRTGIYTGVNVECKVYYPEFSHLQANSGASLTATRPVEAERLSLQATTGGSIALEVDVERLFVTAQTAGSLLLDGTSQLLIADVTGGARLEAFGLLCDSAELRANAGATADIVALKSANLKANTGATIRYKGNPPAIQVQSQLGATILKLD